MIRLLKYVMKIFYENENYSKYGRSGNNYLMALIGTAFYMLMTVALLLSVALALSPEFYTYLLGVHFGVPSKIGALAVVGLTILLLRGTIKEDEVSNSGLTKEYVKKAINYMLVYLFAVMVIIGFIGLKYLRHYNPQ